MPGLKGFEQMAEMIISAGYFNFEELAGAPAAELTQLRKILSGGRAGRARLLRKVLGAKSPPAEIEAKKSIPFTGRTSPLLFDLIQL